MVGGWPALFWKHSRVKVYHKTILGPEGWILPRRDGNGDIESILIYFLRIFLAQHPDYRSSAPKARTNQIA